MENKNLGIVSCLGYLICNDCMKKKDVMVGFAGEIGGKAETIVISGGKHSDEICDICGEKLEK